MVCDILNKENRQENKPIGYDWFYSENVCDIVKVGKIMQNGLKERERVLEAGVT